MPCKQQKEAMRREWNRNVRIGSLIVLVAWILVPLGIAIIGFASVWVGIFLFVLSLLKIGWRVIELYSNPEKWMPGYKKDREKKQKMEHYFYHCERNPDGFLRLKMENFEKDDRISQSA